MEEEDPEPEWPVLVWAAMWMEEVKQERKRSVKTVSSSGTIICDASVGDKEQ